MRVLHLILKKRWFDMIASGEKLEEYREIKPFWDARFKEKDFDVIQLRNGYAKHAPIMIVDFLGMEIGRGKKKWGGGGDKDLYVLRLGKILSSLNFREAA